MSLYKNIMIRKLPLWNLTKLSNSDRTNGTTNRITWWIQVAVLSTWICLIRQGWASCNKIHTFFYLFFLREKLNQTNLNIVQETFQGWKTNPGQMSNRNVFHIKYNDVTRRNKKKMVNKLTEAKGSTTP